MKRITLPNSRKQNRPTRTEASWTRRLRALAATERHYRYTGTGRLVTYSATPRPTPAVWIWAGYDPMPLPPRSDLLDAGDWSLDWRTPAGRRQLAVAILAYHRPDRRLIATLLDPFLAAFTPRLAAPAGWTLAGRDVDDWIRSR